VGTGCGYQTAVLAELAGRVFSIEILPELSRRAAERLNQLGYRNVETRVGDGYHGWVDQAPFDGILVTAAADEVPAPLVEQLAPGGRLVIPVGDTLFGQSLKLVERPVTGSVRIRDVLPVAFVPLTGVH
jgi:protein-L-isoaspartate(D-aspartate) O-methyltransferase